MNCKLVWMNRADMKNRPHVSPIPGHDVSHSSRLIHTSLCKPYAYLVQDIFN